MILINSAKITISYDTATLLTLHKCRQLLYCIKFCFISSVVDMTSDNQSSVAMDITCTGLILPEWTLALQNPERINKKRLVIFFGGYMRACGGSNNYRGNSSIPANNRYNR